MAARIDELQRLLAPGIEAMGFALWGVEMNARPRHSLLRLFIDGPNGITVDDCAAVSRQVSATLDVADPITGAYTLEVSSPGLDRPLFAPAQFERYAGQRVKIRLAHLVDGHRNVLGVIRAADANEVEVDVAPDERLRLPWDSIRKANLVVDE